MQPEDTQPFQTDPANITPPSVQPPQQVPPVADQVQPQVPPAVAPVQPLAPVPTPPAPAKSKSKKVFMIIGIVILAILVFLYIVGSVAPTDENKAKTSKDENTSKTSEILEKDPLDLVWKEPDVDKNTWTAVQTGVGERLFKYKSTTCAVYFSQPDGMKQRNITESKKVATDGIDWLAKAFAKKNPNNYKTDDTVKQVKFKQVVTLPENATPEQVASVVNRETEFYTTSVVFPDDGVKGQIVATVKGDFALVNINSCNSEDYAKYSDTLNIFAQSYKVSIKY